MPAAPVFSIVVPTFARPDALASCLRSLGALHYPRDRYEVIVVDDGPSPGTAELVDEAAKRAGVAMRSLSQTRRGPAVARNRGAQAAAGAFVAFTDDDCTPRPTWLTELEAALRHDPVCIAGGTTVNAARDLRCSDASQLLVDYLYEYHAERGTPARFFTSNNFAASADRFREAGGFDETFPLAAGEDREFCERWTRRGGSLVHVERAVVDHWHRLTLRRFARQHFTYGRGAHFLQDSRMRHDPTARPGLPRREPLSFYARMLGFPFTRVGLLRAIPLAALLALSQIAYVSGYVYQRRQSR